MHWIPGNFPQTRLRRMRKSSFMRDLNAEVELRKTDLIYPMFVREGKGLREPVASMPGVCRFSPDTLLAELESVAKTGISAIALFPVIESTLKTPDGREASNEKGLVPTVIGEIRRRLPHLTLIADVALDPYTSHGQDGILDAGGDVDNDGTIAALCLQAVCQASAGVQIVAPSDMMDGRIGRVRAALDQAGFEQVSILSYAAKYASAYYGPFRDAVGSGSALKGDKKSYQMDFRCSDQALREVALDLNEGADMVMVKPGMPYLDIVHRIRTTFGVPTLVYQVSGEYAMIKAAAANGWLNERDAALEALVAMKRAGANGILTYFAKDAATWL